MAPAALAAWVTCWVLVRLASPWAMVVAAVALLVLPLALGRLRRGAAVAMVLVAIATVATSCAWRLADVSASPVAQWAQEHRWVEVEAVVARDARTFERHGQTSSVVELRVHTAQTSLRHASVRDTVTAFLGEPGTDLVVGRHVTMRGRLEPSPDTDVVAILDVGQRSASRSGAWWWQGSAHVRDAVRRAHAHTGRDPAALVPALVDGDDNAIDEQVSEDFQRAGLTHLLAVSGTNLTIVLAVVLGLTRRVVRRPAVQMAVGLLSVVGFVLLARPDPSVLRAAAMGVVGLAALGSSLRGGVRALAVGVLVLLFCDPWLSHSVGFGLSVCATAGILLGTEPLAVRLERWLPRGFAVALAVPTAAQIACTPLICLISGEVSVVAVLANLLVGPVVAPTTVAGLLAGLTALVSDPISRPIGSLAGLGARWLLLVGSNAAALDGASLIWPGPWWTILLVTPVAVVLLVRAAGRPALAIGIALGLIVIIVRPPQPGWPPVDWVFVACDVGQGDAALVRSGPGQAVVIDAGPDAAALRRCLRVMRIDRVPLVVLTHAHADHVQGWEALADRGVERVLVGPTGGARIGVDATPVRLGQRWRVGEVTIDIVGPISDRVPEVAGDSGEGSAVNDASVAARVTVGSLTILAAGDAEPAAQRAMLAAGVRLDADVLKMPHHGSARQDADFLAAVGPRFATISAGRDNDYGHPAPAALNLLRKQGIDWRRTDLDGDIAVCLGKDGQLRVATRHTGPEPPGG